MADNFRVQLEGGAELVRRLHEAGGNARKTLRGATRAGAQPIAADADGRAPATHAKKRIVVRVSSPQKDTMAARIKFSKRAWYLRFREQGVTAHEIKGSPLVFDGRNGLVVSRGVNHPGQAAHPMLRPALASKSDAAVTTMGEAFRKAVVEAEILAAKEDDEE